MNIEERVEHIITNIGKKVERKMAALEHLMNAQMHIKLPSSVSESIESLSMYTSYLSDEDKDYIDCAADALKNKRKWDI